MENISVQIIEEGIRIPRNRLSELGKRFYDKGDVVSLSRDDAQALINMGRAVLADGAESIKTTVDASDYHSLKRQYNQLKVDYEQLLNEHRSLQDDYANIVAALNEGDNKEGEKPKAKPAKRIAKPSKS